MTQYQLLIIIYIWDTAKGRLICNYRGDIVNQVKTGELIRHFRTEMNLTQKQLADLINVSDKAVSKWECGNGCPDISILYELSNVLKIDIDVLLSGEIKK